MIIHLQKTICIALVGSQKLIGLSWPIGFFADCTVVYRSAENLVCG
jgi:hypothetical protein